MAEQDHPKGAPGVWKKPNFGLIVGLSAAFIVVCLIIAVLIARRASHDVVPKIHPVALVSPSTTVDPRAGLLSTSA